MTPQQIDQVQQSWVLVAAMDPVVVGQLFYNRLFEIAPEVSPLFAHPIPEQSKKLLTMLSFVISKLNKLDDIMGEVEKLARRHVAYQVKEADYASVGQALLWTLEQGLGEHWNAEVAAAWTTCYATLSGAMIGAAAAESTEVA